MKRIIYLAALVGTLNAMEQAPAACQETPAAIESTARKHKNIVTVAALAEMISEDPNRCPTCNKMFTEAHNLKAHIQEIHDKIKPYVCEECDYVTARKHDLQKHTMKMHSGITHTGEKQFICPTCDQGFTEAWNLTAHIREVHDKIKSHVCEECDYATARKYDLQKHKRRVHPDENATRESSRDGHLPISFLLNPADQ